jgi:hypothetical protein
MKGGGRSEAWQHSYLIASIVQFVAEMIMFATIECLYLQCVIPHLVSTEIFKAQGLLRGIARSIANKASHTRITAYQQRKSEDTESHDSLNAPEFFFVSTQVARSFPNMLESLIIFSYRSILPGEISHRWKEAYRWSVLQQPHLDDSAKSTMLKESKPKKWSMMVANVVAWIPMSVQRLFVGCLQPCAMGGLVFTAIHMNTNLLYTIGFGCAAAIFVLPIVLVLLISAEPFNEDSLVRVAPASFPTGIFDDMKPSSKEDAKDSIERELHHPISRNDEARSDSSSVHSSNHFDYFDDIPAQTIQMLDTREVESGKSKPHEFNETPMSKRVEGSNSSDSARKRSMSSSSASSDSNDSFELID